MNGKLRRWGCSLHDRIWAGDPASLSAGRAWLLRGLRILYAVLRDLAGGQLSLQAMSLVYTSLLSLVPLLAVSFSVLKAFGVHNQIQPALHALLAPLGEQGDVITRHVIGFVENMKVGVLGTLGLSLLLYTVVSLLQKIEQAFNRIWRVPRPRPFAQRFSQYISVLLVGPVLVFSALGITGSLLNSALVNALLAMQPLGTLIALTGKLVPYLLVIAAFTFVYVFIPNTRVRLASALSGALVAGLIWQTGGWAFAAFIATSSHYTAIYAGFAILVLFMIWLYLSWLILLTGASIAFYHQYPEHAAAVRRAPRLGARNEERFALWVASLIATAYYHQRPAWTLEGLARQVVLPMQTLMPLLEAMEHAGLIAQTDDEPPHYLPARAFETVTVKELLDAVRGAGARDAAQLDRQRAGALVEALSIDIDSALDTALRGKTLKDLVQTENGG